MRGKDIRDLSPDRWGPVELHDQSRYVEGLCDKCGGWIATNERHETRAWLGGPAEACQHIECPEPDQFENDISGGASSYNRSSYDQVRKPERII